MVLNMLLIEGVNKQARFVSSRDRELSRVTLVIMFSSKVCGFAQSACNVSSCTYQADASSEMCNYSMKVSPYMYAPD